MEDVIQIHSDVIDATSPGEPKHVLDPGRLEAAVMSPQQTFGGEFVYPSVYEMAAAYLIGLASGHAFQQGNKRIAFMACYDFLLINGLDLDMTDQAAIRMTYDVVVHKLDRDDLVAILREHCLPVTSLD